MSSFRDITYKILLLSDVKSKALTNTGRLTGDVTRIPPELITGQLELVFGHVQYPDATFLLPGNQRLFRIARCTACILISIDLNNLR